MTKLAFFLVMANLLSSRFSVQAECCLCAGCRGVDPSKYGYELYSDEFEDQMSCVELDWKVDGLNGNSCSAETNKWRKCCCSNGNANGCPASLDAVPTDPPRVNFPAGNYPYCDLCKNGQYPKSPYSVATIASIPGNPTCSDLYWMGRSNNIPASICYPVQNFLEEPCGCRPEGAGNPQSGPTPSQPNPTPSQPNPAPTPFTSPKDPQRTTKDNLRIGVVGRAHGESENA